MQLEQVHVGRATTPDDGSGLLGDLLYQMTTFVMAQSDEKRARLLGFFHLADADQTSIQLTTKDSGKVILSIEAGEDLSI